jgi:hypothetical protein
MVAQYRALGRAVRGIVDSHLHRYHHLCDASTQTDNLIFDPSLKPYQVEGNRSGTPDDRWVFTGRTPSTNYMGIGSLAAASRALRGFNDALADECLALARKAYAEERDSAVTTPPTGFEGRFGQGAEMTAVLQLLITTGAAAGDRFNELIWPSSIGCGWAANRIRARVGPWARLGPATAVRAPFPEPAAAEKLRPHVVTYKAEMDELPRPTVRCSDQHGEGGQRGVVGPTNYYLHKAYPDVIDGSPCSAPSTSSTHPASNVARG